MTLAEYARTFARHIYCMSIPQLMLLCLFAAWIFRNIHRRAADAPWWRPCIGLGLILWTGVVLWMTVLNRPCGSTTESHWLPLYTYWTAFSGGNPELPRSGFMNALLFFPAGLLLAGLPRQDRTLSIWLRRAVPLFALFSLGIELTQYHFQLGVAELDDVLHNTLGAVAGYGAFRCAAQMTDR